MHFELDHRAPGAPTAGGTTACCRRVTRLLMPILLAMLWVSAAMHASAQEPQAASANAAAYSVSFDASRNPAADLEAARLAAHERGRNVLLIVGGDWCVWCFLLDRHLSLDSDAKQLVYGGFEVLRVYYGDDNTNQAFLKAFPDFEMFPHFFVVDEAGAVLASVTADVLLRDAKYDTGLIRRFVQAWQPRGSAAVGGVASAAAVERRVVPRTQRRSPALSSMIAPGEVP